jgi:NDP-sugar pyrophosphorylase family protein
MKKAMILAAGLGTRLRPITNHTPKPLVEVNGIPLIFYNLALLKKYGFKDIVINLFHLGDQIENLLGDGKKFGFQFSYSHEPEILGTGGGIKFAEKLLQNEDFLVMNSDIICDFNLEKLIKKFQSSKALACMGLKALPDHSTLSIIELDNDGEVVSIIGKPFVKKTAQKTFFTGIHVLSSKVLSILPDQNPNCIIRDGYLKALDENLKISGVLYDDFWTDCGKLDELKKIEDDFSQNKIHLSYQSELDQIKKVLDEKI